MKKPYTLAGFEPWSPWRFEPLSFVSGADVMFIVPRRQG
jgi:hypothetical protein